MTDSTGAAPALTRKTIIRLDLNRDPTWGDLREYVRLCAAKPDTEVIGLEVDDDAYTGTSHLDALIERI